MAVLRPRSGTPKREDIDCPSRSTRFDGECSSTPRPATGFEGFPGLLICGPAGRNEYGTTAGCYLSSAISADADIRADRLNELEFRDYAVGVAIATAAGVATAFASL